METRKAFTRSRKKGMTIENKDDPKLKRRMGGGGMEPKTVFKWYTALASVAQLVGASSHKPKGHRFNSKSGYVPRLWVWFPVKACTGGWGGATNRCFFHIDVSLSLSLSSSLSGINGYILGWGVKKKNNKIKDIPKKVPSIKPDLKLQNKEYNDSWEKLIEVNQYWHLV